MSSTELIVLVTGVNSGLGLALAQRLVSDFLASHPSSSTLNLILTTRSTPKSVATLQYLVNHIASLENAGYTVASRIKLNSFQVDLTNLASVVSLADELRQKFQKIDVVIFNAGMGRFTGIDWLQCFKCLASNWINAVTYPDYKIQAVGCTKSQKIAAIGGVEEGASHVIGEVFCANVFGHYYLAHELMPLLRNGGDHSGDIAGRLVWVSSLEAYKRAFNLEDLQGLNTTLSYESSKRLTDVLSLSASIPATEPYTKSFFSCDDVEDSVTVKDDGRKVKSYLTHPGICATSIVQLHFILSFGMTIAFYIARWLGSPWHVVKPWIGAASMCELALASSQEIEEKHAENVKWGSATNFWGASQVRPTDVEGYGGEDWEVVARETWKRLEDLRKLWKNKLKG
ncbi:hypothetical protein EDC01DRAFT_488014 [Geopyxis carbonaria]|nr:hypothetical protein EDC01DRAFT_488014 [Geopyxis carbonaria]